MKVGVKKGVGARRKLIAVAISLFLHAALISAFLVSTSDKFADMTVIGEGQTETDAPGESVEVDLMGHDESVKAIAQAYQPPSPETSRFSSFMEMAATDQKVSDFSVSKPNPAQSISDALGENPFQPQSDPASAPKSQEEAHVQTDETPNKTQNDLWKAIAPCWNRIADKSSLPVTLQVSFSPMGNLAKPPTIIREPGVNINDASLRSEGQAISALSQCGPYLMAFGQENVQINFPKKH
ncbi:hypothetical protein [Asticcacaulis sp. 201]|uniref:hypothetical protein n=1 Tax=Asticcacaulis sp. 201 TaxID=3028787 RepID=UPI00291681C2|nr:hypothetical protein [Asticcacaulis sp. 201]MDV6331311.1 hypothetical protein [Asticcacaulis sp. 201]